MANDFRVEHSLSKGGMFFSFILILKFAKLGEAEYCGIPGSPSNS